MPHFFIKSQNVKDDIAVINDAETYKHLVKSRRSKTGENILLIDENQIQYETVLSEINSDNLVFKIEKSYKSKRKLEFDLILAQSPLRSDAQSLVIEKATELGVNEVYPIYTDNCAVNKEIIKGKIERWQKIMFEASKQCERADIPACREVSDLKTVLDLKFDKIIAFCERNTDLTFNKYLSENPIRKNEKVLVIIGPEGGFSQREFNLFREKEIPMITLGNLILKAETAVTVALGNIIYEFTK